MIKLIFEIKEDKKNGFKSAANVKCKVKDYEFFSTNGERALVKIIHEKLHLEEENQTYIGIIKLHLMNL